MQNPFTTTFSKIPDGTYISTDQALDILENLGYDVPSESVYKITGVRGSGKTVILSKIENELRTKKDWLVFDVNPSRDILEQIIAMLYKSGYGKKRGRLKTVNVSAGLAHIGASIEYTKDKYIDIGVELETLLEEVAKKGQKILIGIDEMSKNWEMSTFTLEYGRWLRAGYPVYLVGTGLYENINALSNIKDLTFFRRATTIQTIPLNAIRMSEMYKEKLGVDIKTAKNMAAITKGYAYAFQQLGSLYFSKTKREKLTDVIPRLKTELFAYSYEKIWEDLSEADKNMLRLMSEDKLYKREDMLVLMGDSANSYSVYRDRLLKRGIIASTQGYISHALPYFEEYVKEYGV